MREHQAKPSSSFIPALRLQQAQAQAQAALPKQAKQPSSVKPARPEILITQADVDRNPALQFRYSYQQALRGELPSQIQALQAALRTPEEQAEAEQALQFRQAYQQALRGELPSQVQSVAAANPTQVDGDNEEDKVDQLTAKASDSLVEDRPRSEQDDMRVAQSDSPVQPIIDGFTTIVVGGLVWLMDSAGRVFLSSNRPRQNSSSGSQGSSSGNSDCKPNRETLDDAERFLSLLQMERQNIVTKAFDVMAETPEGMKRLKRLNNLIRLALESPSKVFSINQWLELQRLIGQFISGGDDC
jgi:hypothetical protein